MKFLALIIFVSVNVFAFSLTINSGRQNGNDYYVLHLEDIFDIECKAEQDVQNIYTCKVLGNLDDKIRNQNLPFADILFEKSGDSYNVIIRAKQKSRLINAGVSLFDTQNPKQKTADFSKHFTILIGQNIIESPKNRGVGIDFPITFFNVLRPSIGALDLNKEPLSYGDGADVGSYLSIKKSYDSKAYSEALKDAKKALELHPQSIFASEFWLYYLRSSQKLAKRANDYKLAEQYADDIINSGKRWMKNYPSDRNYPEVLYLITEAYLDKDMTSDANYALDILMTEHPDSPWTKTTILAYADALLDKGKLEDAVRLYEDVLYSTSDLDLASRAAIKLADASISKQKFDDAKEYIQKVIDSNQKYFAEDLANSMEQAAAFRDKGMQDIASQIYKIVFEHSKRGDNFYETALRNLGLSLSKISGAKEAYEYLQRYQKEFSGSEFIPEVSVALDRLFFDLNGTNEEKHKNYAQLMDKYKGLDIGKKALKEEVKLSFEEKNYKKVLGFGEQILDLNDSDSTKFLKDSASFLANLANQSGDCRTLVNITNKYGLKDAIKDKFKLFNCLMRTAKYDEALNLAVSHIRDDDLHDRVEWLSNTSRVLYEVGRYEECIRACDEAMSLASTIKYSDPTAAIFYRFYSLLKLNRFEEALSSINALESLRGNDIRLVEIYDAAAKYAKDKGFDSAALNYSKKAIDMQRKLGISTFSPDIDFIYISSLLKIAKFNEALSVARALLGINMPPQSRIRALYQVAEIYISMNEPNSAKIYVDECLKMRLDSPWKNLCEQQSKLIN
ncbi:TPR repeat-containing protein [Campylobacter hyointestinalis subsp. hyointestinalis]|uniref:TPR repeat-containing protein n=1 Tax=Campylobacter hyointestinalis subsp. hyointestinalis TaxID=91352 RepID=A0A0S4S938_CAMHY|nr:tetratricopeptide repeat protein [Campylobacter hyointestinalis]CUU77183.1 TPR repeat-containing protein [Campylobacter hyointestinalis subsp. hyointestinalis]CUU82093.1 TPR repeat-containing protein [Campylobacter hyointestinalis subsp. hyointestinalis]